MTSALLEQVCRALVAHEGDDPDGPTSIADRPKRWMLVIEDARAALEGARTQDALEAACRSAADPRTGYICWVGVSVHRAADIVDAVLGAALEP
jgi:hypothetical protein